jgi:hypothetical protein
MRIFIRSHDRNTSPYESLRRACETLRLSFILSARVGGIINDRPVLLVADPDVPQAVAILKRSGIEAVTD